MEKNNVCIGIPIRDRSWILKEMLGCILLLDYPKEKIGLRFIVNDSHDNSFDMLMNFKRKFRSIYRYISIWTLNTGASVKDERTAAVRRKTIFTMGILKNILLDSTSRKDDYFLYMDSDILLKPDTLNLLVDANKDVIGGLCQTSKPLGIFNFLMYNSHFKRFDRDFDWNSIYSSEVPVRVDLISGIILIKNWLLKKIRFCTVAGNCYSEDVGAMEDLMKLNVERFIHPLAKVDHIMDKDMLEEYYRRTGNNFVLNIGEPTEPYYKVWSNTDEGKDSPVEEEIDVIETII